jgi:hypothetical protein
MSRIVWVGVGAIGGVIAYRRGQRALNDARERGLVGNVQHAALTISSVANGANKLIALAGAASANANSSASDRLALEQDAARWRDLAQSGIGASAGPDLPQLSPAKAKRSGRSTARRFVSPGSVETVDLRSANTIRVS